MGPQCFTGVVERFVYVTSTAISRGKSTIGQPVPQGGKEFFAPEYSGGQAGEAIEKK